MIMPLCASRPRRLSFAGPDDGAGTVNPQKKTSPTTSGSLNHVIQAIRTGSLLMRPDILLPVNGEGSWWCTGAQRITG
jgi:hypothetical protein